MLTTTRPPDPLFAQARRFADANNMTMKTLIEQGLRKVMAEQQKAHRPFKLRDGSVGGKGLAPEFQGAAWDQIRDAAYEGRG